MLCIVRFEIDDAQRWNVECRITSSIRSRTEWSKSFFSSVLREREQNNVRGFSYSLAIFMYGIHTTHSRAAKEKKKERNDRLAAMYTDCGIHMFFIYFSFRREEKTQLRKMPVCFCIPLYFFSLILLVSHTSNIVACWICSCSYYLISFNRYFFLNLFNFFSFQISQF